MNIEEKLRQSNLLLKQLLLHTSPVAEDENKQNEEEIEAIDESIEKYEAEVEELKQKLANEDNYKRTKSDFELNERPLVEELIAESISAEREDIFKSNQLYRKQQEQQTKMLGVYNGEVSKLKDEIKNIEVRLNKDSIAKKRGIAKKLHLSDSEVVDLQLELNYKQELIQEGNQVIEICAEEIRRYGRLITENNARLKTLTEKEQRLSDLLFAKEKKAKSEIDKYKIRLDQDELSKKISGLKALKNRKEFLLYDPSEEIKKQIKQNEEILATLEKTTTKLDEETVIDEKWPKTIIYNKEDTKGPVEEKMSEEVQPTTTDFKPIDPAKSIIKAPEKAIVKEDDTPKELIEILDAPQELKKQKLSDKVKQAWTKWRDKAIATAVAAAITITAGMGLSKLVNDSDKEMPNVDITHQDNLPNLDENIDFTIKPEITPNTPSNDENKEDISQPEDFAPVEPITPEVEKPVVEETKQEAPKVEVTTPEIPEVEVETSEVKPQVPQEEVKPELPKEEDAEVKLEGIVNNSDIETTVLQTEGEFVDILLKNGEYVCVKYGDNGENVPSEITIKYIGTDMYIYSPIVNTKSL